MTNVKEIKTIYLGRMQDRKTDYLDDPAQLAVSLGYLPLVLILTISWRRTMQAHVNFVELHISNV